jgi:hypothetical protein
MKKSTFCIFLLFNTLLFFPFYACNNGDKQSSQPAIDSAGTKNNTIAVTDLLAAYIPITSLFNRDTISQINNILSLTNAFDSISIGFKRDSFEIEEKTTEGGELVAVRSSSTQFIRIDGELFGEMGKLEFKFYMLNKADPLLSCVIYKHTEYDKPMYEKDMKMGSPVITYEIYGGNRLVAVLNNQRKKMSVAADVMDEKERDTKQFVKDYIRQADILK